MTGKTITVRRPEGWYGKVRKVCIRIDGHDVDILGDGESVTFEIPKDADRIRASLDWVKSRPVKLSELPDGAVLEVHFQNVWLKLGLAVVIGFVLGAWISGEIGWQWTNAAVILLAVFAAMSFDPNHLQLKLNSQDMD